MWTILVISIDWAIRVAMVITVLMRKRGSDALAWLAVCLAFPVIGLFLYLLIGGNRLGRRRSRRYAEAVRELGISVGPAGQRCTAVVPKGREDLARLGENLGELPTLGGNSAELIDEPTEYLNRIILDIDGAKSRVHALFYIFEDDRAGREVGEALKRASARGVKVRLLVDAVGSRPMLRRFAPELRAAGVEVRDMLPVTPFRRRLARIDLRNHRKIVIVDSAVAFTGSQNIVDPQAADSPREGFSGSRTTGGSAGPGNSGPGPGAGLRGSSGPSSPSNGSSGDRRARFRFRRARQQWDDLSVRLRGPIVAQAERVFLEDWYTTTGEVIDLQSASAELGQAGKIVAQVVPSGPTSPTHVFHKFILAALHDANRSIELCTAYFVPDEAVILALKIARARGVEVDLVVPSKSDQWMVALAARAHFEELLEAGIRVHEHRGLMLHSKSLAIDDDLCVLGSGNIDMRSFHLNFEVSLVVYGTEFNAALRRAHARYVRQSRALDRSEWSKRPAPVRLGERAVALLSPLL
ncbi:MAG: PLDc N-terminal domain-containing protein [Planctomycetes bacterium]|nr:PLDc N-terminal domain-containing protein [Planctomycetota bacterium]